MTTQKQIADTARVMIKVYGKNKALAKCSAHIHKYEEKVEELPLAEHLNQRFADQIMLEFYKDVYLHLNLI